MSKIILKTGEEIIEEDFFEFNRLLKENEVRSFEVEYYSRKVLVDLENQTIYVDGEKKVEENLENVRWINFRRNKISYVMSGGVKKQIKYGVGFQGNLKGQNIKKIVLINETGELE